MNTLEEMNSVLIKQKEYFVKNGAPSIELRIDRLERLKSLIMNNRYDFVETLNSDFEIDLKMHPCCQMYME